MTLRDNCLTFNYDELLDSHLFNIHPSYHVDPLKPSTYWHPDGGYGFFCHPGVDLIRPGTSTMDMTKSVVLKLHGSLNWRTSIGAEVPYSLGEVYHWSPEWFEYERVGQSTRSNVSKEFFPLIKRQLNAEPLIIPPLMVKEAINQDPIIRVVWTLASKVLKEADQITFIGYSMPVSDIAASTLFRENIKASTVIKVVDRESTSIEIEAAYRRTLNKHKIEFSYEGAETWCSRFPEVSTAS